MPKFTVSKSTFIEKPVDEVYAFLNNMSNWHIWSPWLITDENAKATHSEDNQKYSWEGERLGSGNMIITNSENNNLIDYDLQILKPWKSNSKVRMSLQESNDATRVTWSMQGSLPFFLFWLKKTMTALIGNDYDRGLRMLKDYLEKGRIESKLTHIGNQQIEGCKYIGIKRKCSIDEIGQLMEKDFIALMKYALENPDLNQQQAFSMYHKWDMKNQQAEYTAGIPYTGDQPNIPEINTVGEIPATTVYTLQHTGRYDHIGNAWSTLYTMVQNKELKIDKSISPFETYGNSPRDTPPHELIAYINFPLKT